MNIKIKAALSLAGILSAVFGLVFLSASFLYAVKTFWFGTILLYTVGCIYLAFMLYILYSMILVGIEMDEQSKKRKKMFPGPFTPEDQKKWRESIKDGPFY
jgi:predicted membrane protein